MIATILKSSSSFSAVRYNERKVENGVAELVTIRNFGYLQDAPDMRGITSLRNYLMDYSARNDRTRMTQFHAAISCKGSEYSKEELIKIAEQYLDKMGYNNEGQPVLMYFHHDTDNNHLHIVTSRISPDGKKIADSMENIRSLRAIESIMSIDQMYQNSEMMKLAKSYHFESVSQFMAIFETSGYEAYIQDKDIYIKKVDRYRIRLQSRRWKNFAEITVRKRRSASVSYGLFSKSTVTRVPAVRNWNRC